MLIGSHLLNLFVNIVMHNSKLIIVEQQMEVVIMEEFEIRIVALKADYRVGDTVGFIFWMVCHFVTLQVA